MKIAIGTDHSGVELKDKIISKFSEVEFDDVGTNDLESCDYPDYANRVGKKIQNKEVDLGIVICGTGMGISIAANKMKGIRAALCFNEYMAEMSRMHNDANVLAIGARVIEVDIAFAIIEKWLKTPFEGGRHQRRVDKINEIEDAQ